MKTTLRVGFAPPPGGSVVAVAAWPQGEAVPLEGTQYGSAVRFEIGLAAAMLGLLLVLLAAIV
jgi:hypothetical protein